MIRLKVLLMTALGALAVSAVAASSASADSYSCVFEGAAGPVTGWDPAAEPGTPDGGVESIETDRAQGNEGDSPLGDPLLDTDNGNGRGPGGVGAGGEDGDYSFATASDGTEADCLYVEDDGDPNDSGLYSAVIKSAGEYDNVVCGTGWAIDNGIDSTGDGTDEITTVDLLGNAADIVDPADALGNYTATMYRIDFTAGQGALDIVKATNSDGETGSGTGVVSIQPTASPPGTTPCVDGDVSGFSVEGSFTGTTTP